MQQGEDRGATPGAAALPARRTKRHFYSVEQVPWIFLAPAFFIYAFIVLYPAARGSVFAFTDWDGLTQRASFVGLDNFREFLNDPQAVAAIKHTLELAAVITIVQNVIGLTLAMGVHARLKTRQVLRVIFFAPVVLVPLVVAYIWQYLMAPDGPLNTILGSIGLGGLQQDWLGDPNVALWSIAVMSIWQYVGYTMVIFVAGLQGVPDELIEAASLDGAGPARRFRSVILPFLAPAMTVNVMLTLIGSLKIFDQIFPTTNGGPGYSTESLATLLYKQAFDQNEFGYGSATGLVLTVLVLAISLVVLSILRRNENAL